MTLKKIVEKVTKTKDKPEVKVTRKYAKKPGEAKAEPKRKRSWYEIDEGAFDNLDDYRSEGFWRPTRRASTDYLDDMWGRQGWGTSRRYGAYVDERDTKVAHGMVQGFLNSFSRDGRYIFAFDDDLQSAGTNMKTRIVKATPAPLLDQNITAQQAGHILTALALHEICHPRYGRNTAEAVERVFGRSVIARRLSNLLDDVRIERRFVENYPGYTGIFEPALKYIGDGMVAKNGGKPKPEYTDQYNVAVGAIRYPDHIEWDSKTELERDWWTAWADRWAPEDSPRRHVAAIREALDHVVDVKARRDDEAGADVAGPNGKRARESDDSGRSEDDSGTPAPGGASNDAGQGGFSLDDLQSDEDNTPNPEGDASGAVRASQGHDYQADGVPPLGETDVMDDQHIEDEEGDLDLGQRADEDEPTDTPRMPSCAGSSSVDAAAEQQGVTPGDVQQAKSDAQDIVEDAMFHEDDGRGGRVDVARSLRGIVTERAGWMTKPSDAATRYVRDALLSSRTGHTDIAHYRRRGRLDERGLHRIATSDYRLFDKRSKQSPGKYLVWVMVDKSSSMDGLPSEHAAQVAHAIASASEHVPSMRVAVWGWSNQFRPSRGLYATRMQGGVALAWQSGGNLRDVFRMANLPSGGTPDASILSWASRAILRDAKVNEQPVIIMASDGQGYSMLYEIVDEARQRGVRVVSVAIGASVREHDQRVKYGEGNYVTWRGSIIETARPLARMLANIVGTKRRA